MPQMIISFIPNKVVRLSLLEALVAAGSCFRRAHGLDDFGDSSQRLVGRSWDPVYASWLHPSSACGRSRCDLGPSISPPNATVGLSIKPFPQAQIDSPEATVRFTNPLTFEPIPVDD